MEHLNRTELKILTAALDLLREKMRADAAAIVELIEEDGFTYNDRGEEYNRLVRLQDRIIDALESRFY
jgi:hypothetical protein